MTTWISARTGLAVLGVNPRFEGFLDDQGIVCSWEEEVYRRKRHVSAEHRIKVAELRPTDHLQTSDEDAHVAAPEYFELPLYSIR